MLDSRSHDRDGIHSSCDNQTKWREGIMIKSKHGKRLWQMAGDTLNGQAVVLLQVDGARGSSGRRVVSKENLRRNWLMEDEFGRFTKAVVV